MAFSVFFFLLWINPSENLSSNPEVSTTRYTTSCIQETPETHYDKMYTQWESMVAKHKLGHNSHYQPKPCLSSSNAILQQMWTNQDDTYATCHTLAIDIKAPLPRNQYLLVLVDYRSKYPLVYLLPSTSTSAIIMCLDQLFSMFGYPNQIISDNSP